MSGKTLCRLRCGSSGNPKRPGACDRSGCSDSRGRITLVRNQTSVLDILSPSTVEVEPAVIDGLSAGPCESSETIACLVRSPVGGRWFLVRRVRSSAWLLFPMRQPASGVRAPGVFRRKPARECGLSCLQLAADRSWRNSICVFQ